MNFNGIEKLSLVDYDGHVSATVFTKGCNFLCPFCHNASLVLAENNDTIITETEVLDYLKKRQGVIDALVITGGEPTLYKDLPLFIKKVKDLGLKVKLDSNGTNPEMIKNLIDDKLIDYVAMDIKNCLPMYPITIGKLDYDTKNIEKTTELLLSDIIDYEFRTTLVNGLHEEKDFEEIALWLKGARKYFLQKFTDQGNCIANGLSETPKEKAERFREILNKTIKQASLRGYD